MCRLFVCVLLQTHLSYLITLVDMCALENPIEATGDKEHIYNASNRLESTRTKEKEMGAILLLHKGG